MSSHTATSARKSQPPEASRHHMREETELSILSVSSLAAPSASLTSCSSRSHEDPPNPRAARYRRKLPGSLNPPVVGVPQTPTAAASKPRVPADAVPSQSDTPPHLVLDARRSLITYISQVQLDHDAHRATRLTPRLYSPANRTARTTATRVRQHRTAAAAAADEQRQIPSLSAKSGTHPVGLVVARVWVVRHPMIAMDELPVNSSACASIVDPA